MSLYNLKNIQLDTYNTRVQYRCQDGSQFDTDGDGEGDTPMVEIRCQVRTEMRGYNRPLQ